MSDKGRARDYAADFFNRVWELLDQDGRSAAEDLEMVHLAHASRAHWQVAGGPREWAIGEWQVARVYAELCRAEPSLVHSAAAMDLASQGQLGAFLAASTLEGRARALHVAGRHDEAVAMTAEARNWAARIEDREERDVLDADLADLQRFSAPRSS